MKAVAAHPHRCDQTVDGQQIAKRDERIGRGVATPLRAQIDQALMTGMCAAWSRIGGDHDLHVRVAMVSGVGGAAVAGS